MADTYHLDLSRISLTAFFETLRAGNISPGRAVLLEHKDERKELLRQQGLATLGDLAEALKTKPRLESVAEATGLPVDYLTILRRQALSWLPSPVALDRFSGVEASLIEYLQEREIRNSRHLFQVGNLEVAPQLREQLGRLSAMSDLVRINGVGPVFAGAFVEIGVDGTRALAGGDADEVLERLKTAPSLADYKGPTVTRWDVEHCIRFAGLLVG